MAKKKKKKSKLQKLVKKVRALWKRFVTVSLYYICRLFPRSSKIIVFGAEGGRNFAGNPKYLFLEAAKYDSIKKVWITKRKKVVNEVRSLGFECYHFKSLKGVYYQLRAKTIIMSHSIAEDFNRVLVSGAVSFNTWHGVGLKRSWFRNKNSFAYKVIHNKNSWRRTLNLIFVKTNLAKTNYVISTSKDVSSYYPDTYLVPKDNIFELGQARNDVFFDDSLEEQELPDFIKNEKIITYMPTHRYYGRKKSKEINVNSCIDYDKIAEICERYGYKFLIKNHIRLKSKRPIESEHVIDITNYNYDPQLILKYTDILITDYSSCYTDYLLLDKPVLFYCFDLEEYLSMWELNFDYDNVTPGPKVTTSDDLVIELSKYMSGIDDYKDERKRVKDIFYSPENQGKVAEAQMKFIYDMITGDKKSISSSQKSVHAHVQSK